MAPPGPARATPVPAARRATAVTDRAATTGFRTATRPTWTAAADVLAPPDRPATWRANAKATCAPGETARRRAAPTGSRTARRPASTAEVRVPVAPTAARARRAPTARA